MAKGTPTHFATISFPILLWSRLINSPCLKAIFANKDHESSTSRPCKSCVFVDPIISATFLRRVVTIILLPLPLPTNKSFNLNHFSESSFHKSSKTSKYFFSLIFL
ncbi:hypothetical protein P3X46_024138 [Hevea brasiliensis]|uniref:Uncharacterized protein n=1 Tax=Hevea brasiliensis TaxID=3981 RepID=A0ABQ9L1N4_HEVBR|nr:hypothetical protein P3X46_024138 [Hevea brasiliensis]